MSVATGSTLEAGMSAAMMQGASSSKGGGGAPGGLSAKQQRLFELRMRMVLRPLAQAAAVRADFRYECSGEFANGPAHCPRAACWGDRRLSVRAEQGFRICRDTQMLTCEHPRLLT